MTHSISAEKDLHLIPVKFTQRVDENLLSQSHMQSKNSEARYSTLSL